MQLRRGHFGIEQGEYGPALILKGDWRDPISEYMLKNNIRELIVNYAHGFDGDSLDFLAKVPFLEGLQLLVNHIQDISPIHSLHKLRSMVIGSRDRTRIDFSQFPNLEDCGLHWRPGADSVFQCKTLRALKLGPYPNRSSTAFSSLQNLQTLDVQTSQLTEVRGIGEIRGLQSLGLHYCSKLEALSGIENLRSLQRLKLTSCRRISALQALQSLDQLKWLSLEDCGDIESLRPIANFNVLEELRFAGSTRILDGEIGFLRKLPQLRYIAFANRRHYSLRCEDFPQCHR